ncbi:MAG: glycosyltransferase family 2 protein [Chloroflexi bacterium]|nr:glycosyltransferase family 2 protein [Chloroflexota bacterium]
MPPEINLILLNWNGWRDTLACLESLRSMDYPAECLQITIIDNGSTDESLAHLEALAGVSLLRSPVNLGYAGGNNLGIRQALSKGREWILLLNNDTIVGSSFIMEMLQIFEKDPDAGIVCPKIYYHDRPDTFWYAGGKFRSPRLIGEMVGMGEIDRGQFDQARQVDFAVGACMLIHAPVFAKIGLLDENFVAYEEDIDFSYRARQAGFSIWYQPAAKIWHKVSASTQADPPQRVYLSAQSRALFFRKHIRGASVLLVVGLEAMRLVRVMARSLWQGKLELGRSYAAGLWSGLKKKYD